MCHGDFVLKDDIGREPAKSMNPFAVSPLLMRNVLSFIITSASGSVLCDLII